MTAPDNSAPLAYERDEDPVKTGQLSSEVTLHSGA